MPKPKKNHSRVKDALRPDCLADNVGLFGIPGIEKAGGWSDPAFRHICQVAMEMRGSGVELTRETMEAVVKMGRARHAKGAGLDGGEPAPSARAFPSRQDLAAKGVVYYVRRGALVKIGTTIRLKRRMAELLPDEVLAVEPGSYALERRLHERFAHLRAQGLREYFRSDPELNAHIARVVERHGPPPSDLLVFGNGDDPLAL